MRKWGNPGGFLSFFFLLVANKAARRIQFPIWVLTRKLWFASRVLYSMHDPNASYGFTSNAREKDTRTLLGPEAEARAEEDKGYLHAVRIMLDYPWLALRSSFLKIA